MRNYIHNTQGSPAGTAGLSGGLRTLGRTALGLIAGIGLCAPLLGAEVSGFVKREIFRAPGAGEPNANPAAFANPNYPASPDLVTYIDSFASPQTANPNVEDFLTKLSGFIKPATTGDYVFFLSADDHAAFYLSTDESPANLKLIAQETAWSNPLQWVASGGSSSLNDKRSDLFAGTTWPGGAVVHLEAGKKYYAEALGKEGGGGDNTGVTMLLASAVIPDVAPLDGDASTLTGALISTEAPTALGFLKQPQSQTIVQGRPVTFSVTAVTPPGNPAQDATLLTPDVTYQWFKGATAIPPVDTDGDGTPDVGSSDTSSYIIPLVAAGDAGSYTCKITTSAGGTATSTAAVLTVSTDVVPPTIAKVTGSTDFKHVTVTFSEALDASAGTLGNYSLSGGLTISAVEVAPPASPSDPTVVTLTTSVQPQNTPYTLTVNNVKDAAGNAIVEKTGTFSSFVFKSGFATYKTWQNQNGGFATFVDNAIGATPPTSSTLKTSYQANAGDEFDNYFGQLTGYFIPATSGNYVFYMSSDDHGEMYLSSDEDPANKKKIAEEPSWSSRNNWTGKNAAGDVVDNAGTRGEDGSLSNRSDQYGTSEWPTVGTITLQQGKKYYLEVLFKEGGGGDNGGATFKLADGAEPAPFSASALTGSLIGTYVDPDGLVPLITTAPAGQFVNAGEAVTLTVVAESASPATYQWYRNNKVLEGATSATYTIASAGVNNMGDYRVSVANKNGTVTTDDNFGRVVLKNAFVVESEDYNFGGGQTIPAASVMPLASGLYKGKDGLPGIDFHLVVENQTDNPGSADSGRDYRNGWLDGETVMDYPHAPETLGNVDVVFDNGGGGPGDQNRARPDFTLTNNYKVGWGDAGEWYQYTRDFPPGEYSAVYFGSHDGRDVNGFTKALEIVTGDITKVNAATTLVGEAIHDGTGAWSSCDYIPFLVPGSPAASMDPAHVAKFTLGANTTVRTRLAVRDGDLDAILFYKVTTVVAPTVGAGVDGTGAVVITYTGTLLGSDSAAGPFAPVAGATGGSFKPDTTNPGAKFYRSSN